MTIKRIINEPGIEWTEDQLRYRAEAEKIQKEVEAAHRAGREAWRRMDEHSNLCSHEHTTEQPSTLLNGKTDIICQVCMQRIGQK